MKVLLIAPSYARDRNAGYFPMGIAYVSSYIRSQGHTVIPLNMGNLDYNSRLVRLHNLLTSENPDIVGISSMTLGYLECKRLMQEIRQVRPDLPIVLGGDVTSGEPELVLGHLKPDYGVVGEGEYIFNNLLDALENKKDVSAVKGIWHWRDGKLVNTGKGPIPEDLDSLPWPDLDLFGVEEYLKIQLEFHWRSLRARYDRKRVLLVFASRSCPFKCTFCYQVGPYKQRAISAVVDEIESMASKYHASSFDIFDDLFAVNQERVEEFCLELRARGLDIDWTVQMRVNPFVDQTTLHLMRETGCKELFFGVESGSDTILKSMNKGITTKQISRAVKMTREAKIGCLGAFLLGDPAETEATLQESLDFQQKNKMFFSQWSPIIPYPGSKIWKYLCETKVKTPEEKIGFIEKICEPNKYFWRDQVNLTRMSDDVFWQKYVYLRELTDRNYRKQRAVIIKGEATEQYASKMILECPICHERIEHELVYPPECAGGGEVDLNAAVGVQGINIVCMNCRREMHIAAKDIPHVGKVYAAFQETVDFLRETGREVVVMPALDRYKHVFFEDVDLAGLRVSAVLDTRTRAIGGEFLGCEVSELNRKTVMQYVQDGCFFLVFPWVEFQKARDLCEEQGGETCVWNALFSPDGGCL